MPAEIGITCSARADAEAPQAPQVCTDLSDALRARYPDRQFFDRDPQDRAAPRLDVLVLHAHDRGLGLRLRWTAPDGSVTESEDQRITAFDQPLSRDSARSFLEQVITANPIPF